MTNNTTSYVNNQTMATLHSNPVSRQFLAVLDEASAVLCRMLNLIDRGIIPSNLLYSGCNPATIVETFSNSTARYKVIGAYTSVVNKTVEKLISLGCLNNKSDLYLFVHPGFSAEAQATAFLTAYSAIK